MRQIILDTETTGLDFAQGHRVIEIGCVEMVARRLTGVNFQRYLNPQREIDEAAMEVHGITADELKNKPTFAQVAEEFLAFIKDAELVIHNAPFDISFLNGEFALAGYGEDVIGTHCTVVDTLVMAREQRPGQRNNLDALCAFYKVDNSQRTLHGALLDAEILADVYLAMTGGQVTLLGGGEEGEADSQANSLEEDDPESSETSQTPLPDTPVIKASAEEEREHQKWLQMLEKNSQGEVVWEKLKCGEGEGNIEQGVGSRK